MKLLIAAGAVAVAVGLAPTAEATPSQYLNYLHNEGFESGNGDTGLLKVGYAVCSGKSRGNTKLQNVNLVYQNNPDLSHDGAMEIVEAAYTYLCVGGMNA